MIYQAVCEVLEGIDAEGRAGSPDAAAWEADVASRMTMLESAYKDLSKVGRQSIDYGDRAAQAAYLYRYVFGHAEFVAEFLALARTKLGQPLFRPGEIRVISLGGGPASELLGLTEYLTSPSGEAHVTSVHYTLIDKEANWERVATAVARQAGRHIPVTFEFRVFDVEDATATPPSLADADLVIASYFISELAQVAQRQTAHDNVADMLKTMKRDALLLYKDSRASPVLDLLRVIVRRAGGLSEIFEEPRQFTASPSGQHRIMQRYATRFPYGLKLNATLVSKLYRSIKP